MICKLARRIPLSTFILLSDSTIWFGRERWTTMDSEEPSSSNAADQIGQIVSDDDEIDYSVKPEFYDPEMDGKDETWVLCKRQGRKSDALLSCPVCFTTLCIDCQRHEIYVTQYRAMFVINCKVVENQRLRKPAESTRQKKYCKKPRNQYNRNDNSLPEAASEKLTDEVFKPVCCSVCDTEVAVLDENEIYHFFNVMPSHA